MSAFRQEPFRLLFPLGYAFLVLGLGVWSVGLADGALHKESLHAFLMGNGFLFSFAAGILLTESPRLQGNAPLGGFPLAVLLLSLAAMGAAALSGSVFGAAVFHLIAAAILCAYLGYGWLLSEGRREPGPILAFAASLAALCFGAVGALAHSGALPAETGRNAGTAAFQFFLILFAAACLRWSKVHGAPATRMYGIPGAVAILGLSFLIEMVSAYAVHPEIPVRIAYAIRALWFAFYLRAAPGTRTLFADLPLPAWCIRTGTGMLAAGAALTVAFPRWATALNHTAYLLGFTWIVMAAATGLIARRLRTTAPRTVDLVLRAMAASLAAATVLRLAAEAAGSNRNLILSIAAAMAMLPILVWAVMQFPRLADWDRRERMQSVRKEET
jgi:hypothetical protein